MMENSNKKIYRSKSNNIIAGVAGGLATYFGIDRTLVRVIFILLTLWGGSGLLLYIILWLIIPKEAGKENPIEVKKKNDGKFFLGIIFLLVGIIALWNRFFPIEVRWDILWPVILILLGMYIIFRK